MPFITEVEEDEYESEWEEDPSDEED